MKRLDEFYLSSFFALKNLILHTLNRIFWKKKELVSELLLQGITS